MAPKKQVQKMSLGDFLQDSSLGNWADELEDMPVAPFGGGLPRSGSSLTDVAGREYRDRYDSGRYASDRRDAPISRDHEHEPRIPRPNVPLPSQPPYTAHIGNLAFDLTEREIEEYFEGSKVISVRIMKDRIDNRPKGFGYVEFADLDSLKKALTLADGQLAGRTIRISVAEPPKQGSHFSDESAQGEWRSGKVLPPVEHRNRTGDREFRGSRNFSGDSAGRSERREMSLPSLESGAERWERRGPLPPLEVNDRRTRSGNTSQSGSGSYNAASRSPSRESPADTGGWRSSKPAAPPSRSDNVPPVQGGSPIMQRRKLNLLPRSEHAPEKSAPSDDGKSKSNPFGDARPVDTDSALKKVEEKLAKEREQKEELPKGPPTSSAPSSPTAPRNDKARSNPKQLLRRSSANPPTSSAQDQPDSESVKVGVPEQAAAEGSEKTWRKVESQATPADARPDDDEAGWETVPSRGKRANGVGSRH